MKEYIDRADAINLLLFFVDESCASVVSDFENLPAAEVVEVRHGIWINIGDYDMAECSECGEVFDVADQYAEPTKQDFKEFCKLYRYCPNCGCHMDGKGGRA